MDNVGIISDAATSEQLLTHIITKYIKLSILYTVISPHNIKRFLDERVFQGMSHERLKISLYADLFLYLIGRLRSVITSPQIPHYQKDSVSLRKLCR